MWSGWQSVLVVLLHAALIVLTMVCFGREVPKNAQEAEFDNQAVQLNRLQMLQDMHKPGDGFAIAAETPEVRKNPPSPLANPAFVMYNTPNGKEGLDPPGKVPASARLV